MTLTDSHVNVGEAGAITLSIAYTRHGFTRNTPECRATREQLEQLKQDIEAALQGFQPDA